MKILQIITTLTTGGAEKLLVDIAPRLKSKGHDCDVMVLYDANKSSFKEDLINSGVKVIALSTKPNYYNPQIITKLKPYLTKYDVVHVHLSQPQYWASIAKMFSFSKITLVTTEHNTTNSRRDKFWLKPIEKLMYHQFNTIISISEATTRNLIEHIGFHKNIITIENGIDINKFMMSDSLDRKTLGMEDTDFIITMVAGFRPQKDQDTLIRSMKLLPNNVKLLLVGEGVRKEKCKQLAKDEKVENRVVFLGSRNDVARILKTSDVVAMSSHWEGFGLAAVEGMASKKPVIASNVEGLREVVGNAGLLFETGNIEDFVSIIIKLKNSPDYIKKIADSCFERSKKYDISESIEKIIQVYKDAVENRN